ncbi:MAG: division/cell wall cluster transcriptional repressor MraZ [Chloroflexia bacterium]|nr:division/cell wall cluster transcriptional repressor MraZ [Chloroflexia bacterium]
MFLGSHTHNLDTKGRLAIPARFRDELADGLVLTRGFDKCIALYSLAAWETLAGRINELSIADANVRQFRRMVFSEAVDVQLDSQGRILVPAPLRDFAGIEREVVVIGVHSSLEIWSPDRWSTTSDVLDDSSDEIATRLAGML